MTEITMPSLSDSMQEGTILSWLVADGAEVAVGDELVEIETDKATMTYESPAEGTLATLAAVGDTLAVGAPIARLGEATGASGQQAAVQQSDVQQSDRAEQRQDDAPPARTASANGDGGARATPLARRMAGVHGVDLAELTGTGPHGRITRSDVAARTGIADDAPAPAPPAPGSPATVPPAQRETPPAQDGTQELTRTQQLIARRMAEAKATIPHFQVQTDADVGALLELRAQLKAWAIEPVPSLNDCIVRACALALRRHRRANGSYRDGRFELHARVNIGIAVAADDALVVPTIAGADDLSLREIAARARELAAKVRDATITPPELSGATFTVSNLGMYGMTAITPVINPPQAAILGVGAARAVPALVEGELRERRLMTLTLSCDHRILYGADAAALLSDIRTALESPLTLLY